jgi:hypothetical protein
VPSWLSELHQKLWGKRKELFDRVFRAVDLTADYFIELQPELHGLDSSRNHKSDPLEEVLSTKIRFLCSRTATHRLTITSSPIPKVVFDSEDLILVDAMGVDVDVASNPDQEQEGDCEGNNVDDDDAKVDKDKSDEYAKGDQDDQEGEVDDVDNEGGENEDDKAIKAMRGKPSEIPDES